jgi:hypothetical protein
MTGNHAGQLMQEARPGFATRFEADPLLHSSYFLMISGQMPWAVRMS